MSSDQLTIQKSTESNSLKENQYDEYVSSYDMADAVTGVSYYWDFLINCIKIPFFLLIAGIALGFACFVANLLLGPIGAILSIIFILFALVYTRSYTTYLFFYPMFRSIQFFCKTPKNVFPHAALTVILSYILTIAVPIGAIICFGYIANSSNTVDSYIPKTVAVITTLLMYYCYFSFYSLLYAIGKKALTSNICGKILLIITTLCCVFDITGIFYTLSDDNLLMTMMISRIALSVLNAIFLYIYVYQIKENNRFYDNRYSDDEESGLGQTLFTIGGILGVLNFIGFCCMSF